MSQTGRYSNHTVVLSDHSVSSLLPSLPPTTQCPLFYLPLMDRASKIDLHSGFPYWPLKSGIRAEFPKLTRDLPDEECVIIGSGISGALAAHELCSAGVRVTMLDRRLLSSGSTWASTAQLNYEIDV